MQNLQNLKEEWKEKGVDDGGEIKMHPDHQSLNSND